ncbi:DUF7661 family protein [Microbulbifer marinus]|uniref:DUF7661 domain-containing protein n=1 Tax=Microbulbifer marinus TaxID=658218 RepID=A0A1H4A4N7_9GAMM|nr:hypothetical protein [Microbulbifer marinus]SEA30738.1 hypothetical protein SAMN05216562_2535 [Microbulbifer marinus]
MITLKFDIFGRFVIEIRRESGGWEAFYLGDGKRRAVRDLVIPPEVESDELLVYLDDFYHELARPDEQVREIKDH